MEELLHVHFSLQHMGFVAPSILGPFRAFYGKISHGQIHLDKVWVQKVSKFPLR